MRKSGLGGLKRLALTAVALGALLMLAPAAAQATPPVWDSNFGTATSLGNDDDRTSQDVGEDKFTVPFDFEFPGFGTIHKGDLLDISSNGFVELIPQSQGATSTGDIGNGCCDGDPNQ